MKFENNNNKVCFVNYAFKLLIKIRNAIKKFTNTKLAALFFKIYIYFYIMVISKN